MATITEISSHNQDVRKAILWQDGDEDQGGEPAILIEAYNGVLSLQQGADTININWSDLPDLIKQVKKMTPKD